MDLDLRWLRDRFARMKPTSMARVSPARCERLVFHVEARHIRDGQRWSCTGCPLALALREQTRLDWGTAVVLWGPAVVTQWSVYWSQGPELALPADARAWIARFDQAGEGEPFSFTLFMPCSLLALQKEHRQWRPRKPRKEKTP